ncbi:MAG: rhodanese-like domain-containing protein [Spirochaetia bacterium]|nr:rhodanese-like domain-containing protein [Spirochaetia bacterium]
MKRRTLFLILTVILLLASNSLFSFSKKEVQIEEPVISAQYNKIDSMSAKEVFDTQKDITIIDVRTAGEFESGHIENAINIPLDVIEATVLEKYPNKDEKLYLYCRSGNRSSQAAKLLVNQGYTNVYDFGGIISWPYEVVK